MFDCFQPEGRRAFTKKRRLDEETACTFSEIRGIHDADACITPPEENVAATVMRQKSRTVTQVVIHFFERVEMLEHDKAVDEIAGAVVQ